MFFLFWGGGVYLVQCSIHSCCGSPACRRGRCRADRSSRPGTLPRPLQCSTSAGGSKHSWFWLVTSLVEKNSLESTCRFQDTYPRQQSVREEADYRYASSSLIFLSFFCYKSLNILTQLPHILIYILSSYQMLQINYIIKNPFYFLPFILVCISC